MKPFVVFVIATHKNYSLPFNIYNLSGTEIAEWYNYMISLSYISKGKYNPDGARIV
jgi:hypothetical protein